MEQHEPNDGKRWETYEEYRARIERDEREANEAGTMTETGALSYEAAKYAGAVRRLPVEPESLRGEVFSLSRQLDAAAQQDAAVRDMMAKHSAHEFVHTVRIVDNPQRGTFQVTLDGVPQVDVVRYEIVHAVGDPRGVLMLYRGIDYPTEIAGEFEIVDKVANEARRNVHNAAINAFAISEQPPEITGDSLAAILRDAKRYRAIRNEYERHEFLDIKKDAASETLDSFADELRALGLNAEEMPFPPGGDDAPALHEWYSPEIQKTRGETGQNG